jgi:hypothetical protein
MANEQRMRSAMQEASSTQCVCHAGIILTNLTSHRTRSLLCQDAQAEFHERLRYIRFVRMCHNPELMRPSTAPKAQSNPASKPYTTVVDKRDAGRLDQGK